MAPLAARAINNPELCDGRLCMQDYVLLINDSRYSVPTLRLITARNVDEARSIADLVLAESPYHRSVEASDRHGSLFVVPDPPPQNRDPDLPEDASRPD